MNIETNNQPTDEKYKRLLQSYDYRFGINLERLYCNYKSHGHTFEDEYIKLVDSFLHDVSDYERIENVYQQILDETKFYKTSEARQDSYWAVKRSDRHGPVIGIRYSKKDIYEYLLYRRDDIKYSSYECELIDGELIPLNCYALDQDLTVDYFDILHRDFFDKFFYFKLIVVDQMDRQIFLDYHCAFSFNNDLKLYIGFLNSFVSLYTGAGCPYFLNTEIANEIIFWINNHHANLKLEPIPVPTYADMEWLTKPNVQPQENAVGLESKKRTPGVPYIIEGGSSTNLKRYHERIIDSLSPFFEKSDFSKLTNLLNGILIDESLNFNGSAIKLCRAFGALNDAGVLVGSDIHKWISENFLAKGKRFKPETAKDSIQRKIINHGITEIANVIKEFNSDNHPKPKRVN